MNGLFALRGVVLSISVVLAGILSGVQPAAAGVGNTVYLPNITRMLGGLDGWQTPFIVQNLGTDSTSVSLEFFAFADGSLVKTRTVPLLAPGNSFFHDPNSDTDLPAGGQFSVVIRSANSPVAAVVNEHQNVKDQARQEALSYTGLTSGSTRMHAPYFAYNVDGWLTTLIAQNLGSASTAVTLRFTNIATAQSVTLARTMAPGRSQFVDPRIEPLLIVGAEYSVSLSADQPIGLIVNAHNDAPSAPRPMGFSYNGAPAHDDTWAWLPYAARNADGIGRSTKLYVQNIGTTNATPILWFRRIGQTGLLGFEAPAPIAPGSSWVHDLRGPVVPDGEYSVEVAGGQFAVVAATLSPASAMGYTTAFGYIPKWFLPNITRTLGGTTGWTTPIVIQSQSSLVTTARLSWYRFSDGALVTTQTITGLTLGASVRVDPRSVPALSNDAQYAVVVESPFGGIAVLVLELNFQGGDGAMAYEGFVTPPGTPFGTNGCTPSSAPAGTTFACRFYRLPPGATGVTVTTTNPGGSPSTSTSNEPVAADGSYGVYFRGQAQGTRTMTVTAGGVSVSASFIVGPANFALNFTQSQNGRFVAQTKNSIPCTLEILSADGTRVEPPGVLTATSDAQGIVTFNYPPLTTPTGTLRHFVVCTWGSESLATTINFTVP